jgi:DNA-binding cell septation regulator SpoVG
MNIIDKGSLVAAGDVFLEEKIVIHQVKLIATKNKETGNDMWVVVMPDKKKGDSWDKVVYMSTCTSDSSQRFVVFGKCVSTERPYRYVNIFEYLNQSDSETDNKDSGESQEGNADSEGEGTEPSGETESSDGTE